MNKVFANLGDNWERTLFFLFLLALLAGFTGYHLLRPASVEIIPPVKALPAIPAMVPWEDRPLTFMTPSLEANIANPFLVVFNLPAPPAPPTPPPEVAEIPPETPQPPPPPPRTIEVFYTGIYHSLLGKTIAYLKCIDSETGESLANLTAGEEIAPGFQIAEITNEAVTISTPGGTDIQIPWHQSQTLSIPAHDKQQ